MKKRETKGDGENEEAEHGGGGGFEHVQGEGERYVDREGPLFSKGHGQ